jgi:hypothetical protein
MTFDNIYIYILFEEILLRNLENVDFFFDEAIKIFLIELIFGKLSFSQFLPIAADRHEFEIFNSFYHRCCMIGDTLLNYYNSLLSSNMFANVSDALLSDTNFTDTEICSEPINNCNKISGYQSVGKQYY